MITKKRIFAKKYFFILLFTGVGYGEHIWAADRFAVSFPTITEMAIRSEENILEGRHLWVSNEIQTFNPDQASVGSITSLYAPPLNLSPLNLTCRFWDQQVPVSEYVWYPGEIHQLAVRENVEIKNLMMAGYPERKIVQYFELRGPRSEAIPFSLSLTPALERTEVDWGWVPMLSKIQAVPVSSGKNRITLSSPHGEITVELIGIDVAVSGSELTGTIRTKPGKPVSFSVLISYDDYKSPRKATSESIDKIMERSRKRWNTRISEAYDRLGWLSSSNRDLEMFYKRSILTMLTCEWNNEDLLFSPYYAESGIDGGAICSYMWGMAYVSKIFPLYRPDAWKKQIEQAIKTVGQQHYAFTPFTGQGIGLLYSYNPYSVIRDVYDYVQITGDKSFLLDTVNGTRVVDYCIAQALHGDDPSKKPDLIDYGTNENMLELKKSMEYQHFVPSPNAERCWSYRAVDELCDVAGIDNKNLSRRADELAKTINESLWSDSYGWYLTRDRQGKLHFCPTIQIFDLLRCGVMSEKQQERVLRHLNDDEFLSEYGVHSLSKLDPGYDPHDADWGGPGVYTGDGAELVEDLYLSGHDTLAENVLSRLLWWGNNLPYYPQTICAAEKDYRRDGRANVISGFAAAQTVLFSLLDLRFGFDGKISIAPRKNSLYKELRLDHLTLRNKTVSIRIAEGDVFVNGEKVREAGSSARIEL